MIYDYYIIMTIVFICFEHIIYNIYSANDTQLIFTFNNIDN